MIFLKAVWRFIVGVKDVLVLCFLLLFFGGLYAVLSMAPGERPVKTHQGALLIDLDGSLVEQPEEADPFATLLGSEAPVQQYRLRDVVGAVDAARTDANIKAVVLNLDGFIGGGQVALTRLGKALDGVRAAKKPVLVYATLYSDDSYLLAAHGSEVWLNPLGAVALSGPGGSMPYFKGLMDKLGITAHIYRVGTYKSAVEPFMLTGASPEARAANQALVDTLWANWRTDVGKARPSAKIAAYASAPLPSIEAAKGDLSQTALAMKLVDRLGDERAFDERVAALAGEAPSHQSGPTYAAVDLKDYVRAHRPGHDGQIGVITVAGDIVDGEAGPGTAGGDSIATLIDDTVAQGDIRALVVRIDSPGGSVLASERIRSALAAARARRIPIVASMGNVAASGGYWVSTAADKVLAEPSTITGSIGVFGILPSFEGLLAKIGVTSDGVQTTPLSGEPNIMGGFSADFDRISQLGVEDMYRRFLTLVAQARRKTPEQIDRIAQGRVWDGGTARQLGLIDKFGGLEDAIAEAARLAKIDPGMARPLYIDPQPDPFLALVEKLTEEKTARSTTPRDFLGHQAARQRAMMTRALVDARLLGSGASIQARCLECGAYMQGGYTAAPADSRQPDSLMKLWLSALR
jgi:protease-4